MENILNKTRFAQIIEDQFNDSEQQIEDLILP